MGIGQAVGTLAGVGVNAALSKKKAKTDTSAVDRERDRQVREIILSDDEKRRKRLRDLRRELAEQRARAAQSGTGGREGSVGALRRGARRRTIDEDAIARRNRDIEIENVRGRAADRRRRSLLDAEQKTQRSVAGGLGSLSRSLLDF